MYLYITDEYFTVFYCTGVCLVETCSSILYCLWSKSWFLLFQMHNLLSLIKKEQDIYNLVFHELIRQV